MSEISQTMQELQKEMCKAGIIEEMMEDTMAMSEDEVCENPSLILTECQIYKFYKMHHKISKFPSFTD